MNYEVIGWTYDTDMQYPDHAPVTARVELAVRREIVEHGYCFGGDAHEENCPVLNDGTKVCLSWRSWGGLMARARGEEGEYSYMHYYMNELIDPTRRKYPKSTVDDGRIRSRLMLAERFSMHLRDDMFDAMASGKKRVEFRLFDDKRKAIDIGDYIEFTGHGGRLLRRVSALFLDSDFESLFGQMTCRDYGNTFCAEDFGFPAETDAAAFAAAMSEIYTPGQQKAGALALVLEDAAPRYAVSFVVRGTERFDPFEEDVPVEDFFEFFPDPFEIEEALRPIAPFSRCANGFRRFSEDANRQAAVDEVFGEILEKADDLKAAAKKVGLAFSCEIVSLFPDMPPAEPVLGEKIEEFLHKLDADVRFTQRVLP